MAGLPRKIRSKLEKKFSRRHQIDKLDKVFSEFIRRRNGDMAKCVTCGKIAPWQKMQCGHYESRGKKTTRWDEQNSHVQCYRCNVILSGNYPSYARFMVEKYGKDILEILAIRSAQSKHYSLSELELLIQYFEEQLAAVVRKVSG